MRAGAVGQLAHLGGEAVVAQHVVGAGAAGQRLLLVGGDGGDDVRALGLEQLDQQQAHAAGAGVQQHGVARLHLEGGVDQVVRGDALQGERGGGEVVDAAGHRQRLVRVHEGVPGVAVDALGRGHPVAGGEAGHAVAELPPRFPQASEPGVKGYCTL